LVSTGDIGNGKEKTTSGEGEILIRSETLDVELFVELHRNSVRAGRTKPIDNQDTRLNTSVIRAFGFCIAFEQEEGHA